MEATASRDKNPTYNLHCCSLTATPDHAFARLKDWIKKGKAHRVYISDSLVFARNPQWGNGIVCIAPEGLKKGHVVVKMPKTQCLTTRTVSSPELRKLLLDGNFDHITRLTLAYIYECSLRETSQWWGYLSCVTVPDVPRLWGDEEKAVLIGTDVEDLTFDFDVSVQLFHFYGV